MTTLQLPEPKVLSMPLGEALQKRRTNRDCTDAALSDDELAALLWACAGITSEDGRRTVPSTLDLRAVSAYVLRADGSWRFDAEKNALVRTAEADVRDLSTTYQFEYVKKAPVTIVFVADKERSKNARPTGVFVDAGTMGEACYLAATSLGLAGCVRASFDHDALRDGMKLAAHLEPIVLFTVGRAA